MEQRIKYWPTPTTYDFSNENEVPLKQFKQFLNSALLKIPAEEVESATITGVGGLSIHYTHQLTDAEQFAWTLDRVRALLREKGGNGLSREGVEELSKLIGT